MPAPERPKTSPFDEAALLPVPDGPLQIDASAGLDPAVHLSLIIPTYNEATNLAELVERLTDLLEDAPVAGAYELIVVDDDSPDRTWIRALTLLSRYPKLRVMRRTGERGLSTAVIRGWQVARGAVLAVIDADLQHPPEVTVALFREIARGADLAVASRHVEGGGVSDWSPRRRLLSRGAQLLGLLMLPSVVGRVSDPMSGYFMVQRRSIAGRVMRPLGYKILIEVLGRGSIRWIGEVGYVFRERSEGESKVTLGLTVDYLRQLVRLRLATLPGARFLRFVAVAASGVAVDMALLFALSDPRMLGLGLLGSKLVAAEVATVNNFLWNDAWTFRAEVEGQRGLRLKLLRFAKFNAICAMGFGLNVALLHALVFRAGMNPYLANALAILLVTAWNYWMSVKLSWRVTDGGRR